MPPELVHTLLVSLLNPASIAVGWLMGRRADAAAKLIVVGFAAGATGGALVWLVNKVGLYPTHPRLIPGVVVVAGLFGMVWGAIARATARRT